MATACAAMTAAVLAACASEPATELRSYSTLDAPTEPEPTSSSPSPSTPVASDGIDVIVTASGGGGLIDSVEVRHLTVAATPTEGAPWIEFDLVLDYGSAEPDRVVVRPTGAGFVTALGDPPMLQLSGPACEEPVVCSEDARTVTLGRLAPAALGYEITPLVGPEELIDARTLVTTLTPTFDFDHPALDDREMSIEVRVDIAPASPAPSGDTTPIATPATPLTIVGGSFDLLEFPAAAVADGPEQLAAILSPAPSPVDVDGLGIDWSTHAAIVLSTPNNACPRLLAGLDITDRRAEPVFVSAGYLACNEPLTSHTVIASVERSALDDVDELVLAAEPSYFGEPVIATVDITPGTSTSRETIPTEADFGDVLGTTDLPAKGEATTATLTNGTPVFVVHHHDGTISALDPRGAIGYGGSEMSRQYELVRWTASSRNFLGSAAWDEYGRRLDGFRSTDLKGYATRVVDGVVEIGSPVDAPAGSPIAATTVPPAMAGTAVSLNDPISFDEALDLPVGTTALIDAVVVVDPDGARVCAGEGPDRAVVPCPRGSPSADGTRATPGARSAWFGPLLATRTETGFTRIAATGGSAGGAL